MNKFKKTWEWIPRKQCTFNFYRLTGSFGMYCAQSRVHNFCIPYLFGFRYIVRWGRHY